MTFIANVVAAKQQHKESRSTLFACLVRGMFLIWIAGLYNTAVSAWAQDCPNLRGHWVSGSGGGIAMDISQTDCKVSSDNMDSSIGFHHTMRGAWDANQYSFSWNVARLDPRGCWTHLYGRATVTGPSTLNVEITSSEGRCGLPANFRDHGTYTRQ